MFNCFFVEINYKKRIFGLDLMRAIAILLVVFSHLLWIFPEATGMVQWVLSLGGVMGVEIFFVLSGFLIGRILYRIYIAEDFRSGNMMYFFIRRWFRTLPNYYLILLVNIGIVLYLGRELPDTLWKYFFFWQNALAEMNIFFTESWSLSVEEFAYVIGPIILLLLYKMPLKISRKQKFLFATIFVLLVFLVNKIIYYFNAPETYEWNSHLKPVVLYRIDAIFYGVLAAYLSMQYPEKWKNSRQRALVLGFVGFNLLQFLIIYFQWNKAGYPLLWNVFYLPYCSVCIALSLPFFSQLTTPRYQSVIRSVTFISIVSYAMYLLHYSVILQLMRYWIPVEEFSFNQKLLYAVFYLGITLFLSYLLYRYFEKPMMDLREKSIFNKIKPKIYIFNKNR